MGLQVLQDCWASSDPLLRLVSHHFSVYLPAGPLVSVPYLQALLRLLDEEIINHRKIFKDFHPIILAKLKILTMNRAAGGRITGSRGHLGPLGGRPGVCPGSEPG